MLTRSFIQRVVNAKWFTRFITWLIVINCILISVEIDHPSEVVHRIQKFIIYCFLAEILIRWFGRENNSEYLKNRWNYFDIVLVSLSLFPEGVIQNSELLTSLRILRVFRVLRLIEAFTELQIVTRVFFRSISSVTSIGFLMVIVVYLYSIVGVILFRGKSQVITGAGVITDPFGNVLEAMFSMFRVLTGEDWTDLRYDLLAGYSGGEQFLVTLFFISFFILAACLLINLVVGAVCNNYDAVIKDFKNINEDNEEKCEILQKLEEISNQLRKRKDD